jgi:hypothetical protein
MSSSEKVINLTPEMAREWLPRVRTRPLIPSHAETLRQICMRGEWVLSTVPMCVRKDGSIGGGLHRLTAISKCPDGMVFPVRVLFGCTDAEIAAGDSGRPWSHAAILGESERLTQCARTMAHIYRASGVGLSSTYLVPFVDFLRPAHTKLLEYAPHCAKLVTSAPMRLAACLTMLEGGNEKYVLSTYRAMSLKDYANMPPIAAAFMRQASDMKLHADKLGDLLTRAHRVFSAREAQKSSLAVKDASAGLEWVKSMVVRYVHPTDDLAGQPAKPLRTMSQHERHARNVKGLTAFQRGLL